MSFDGARWLPVAVTCAGPLEGVDEQASLRTAVGRAYYAPLMMIKGRVEETQGPDVFPDGGTHYEVFRALRNSKIREFQRVLEMLKILRDLREAADYDLENGLDADDVEAALKRSRKLVEDLLPSIPLKKYRSLPFSR